MKNIWRIFSGDMKRLVRNPFALVIAIGLCIIPSLYAWFNTQTGIRTQIPKISRLQ